MTAPAPEAWTAVPSGQDHHLHATPADPDRHAAVVSSWGRTEHVAPWWPLAGPVPEVHAYLAQQAAQAHLTPWVVALDGRPFAYLETYAAAADPLAAHYAAEPGDQGWHVLVGPPELLGTGVAQLLGRAVLARLLAHPGTSRVVCEPDVRNTRMIRFCRRLGHEVAATLALPDKQAALLVCTRETFVTRWPDDLAAGRAVTTPVHDVIGVGVGPFNLGLAALLAPVPEVRAAFFDAGERFTWHPGLLLEGTTLQVPFLADLVTMADPTSRYGFLNYLHQHDRLYRFYFYERFHVPRREYQAYCAWVAAQLPACRFGWRVAAMAPVDGPDGTRCWDVEVHDAAGTVAHHLARAVVAGVGTRPVVPAVAEAHLGDDVFHSASYLDHRAGALAATTVTVIGSGQSAGEIVADLLEHGRGGLRWYTRSAGFLPMEYSKLGLEHFSPEHTTYFHGLDQARRDEVRAGQDLLYKGLSAATGNRIYDLLYERSVAGGEPDVRYAGRCELRALAPPAGPGHDWSLTLHQPEQGRTFTTRSEVVVLATGYEGAPLPVDGCTPLCRDDRGRLVIDRDHRVRAAPGVPPLFVQHGDLHTHGVGAPDLGLAAHRNATIVNSLVGRQVYAVKARNVFQSFGAPEHDEVR